MFKFTSPIFRLSRFLEVSRGEEAYVIDVFHNLPAKTQMSGTQVEHRMMSNFRRYKPLQTSYGKRHTIRMDGMIFSVW